jgi:outer membrane protein insertion porin family
VNGSPKPGIQAGGVCGIVICVMVILLLSACATGRGSGKGGKPVAELEISGYGWLGNRNLKQLIGLLESPLKREYYDANFIEDSTLVLTSGLTRDGFLHPEITVFITREDGRTITHTWSGAIDEPLPRPLRARKVEFKIKKGVLYYYDRIVFTGLKSVDEKQARSFFMATGGLLPLKKGRVYTPENLRRGESSLTDTLQRKGYQAAQVSAAQLVRDDRTGKVNVVLHVEEGLPTIVHSVSEETFRPGKNQPEEVKTVHPGVPYSEFWLQDFIQAQKDTNYHRGYPDTTVTVSTQKCEVVGSTVELDLLAKVNTGPLVRIGKVGFQGEKKTKESVMAQSVRLKPGDLLDPSAAEHGRYRLSGLGVFESVDLRYDNVDEHTRNLTYEVKEGRQIDVSLLAGFGSYELFRGGFEIEKNNIFGLAHRAEVRAAQSFKLSRAEFTYTIPEVLGSDVDAFINVSGLRFQEISFTREEFIASPGLHRTFRAIASDGTIRYSYQILNATQTDFDPTAGLRRAKAGAVVWDFRHYREDNPLEPRTGYRIISQFELASDNLGGNANYQRFEVSTSYHHPLGSGQWLHLALTHGAVFTPNGPQVDLPFDKRFFPGGPNSVRGYQPGEAAPRNAAGVIVGAESYVLANVELERALTANWSLVAFSDSVGLARSIVNYPANEALYSVGGGIYWKTPVGPVRLEYGYNLNRRPRDPVGTIQFSVGFPF